MERLCDLHTHSIFSDGSDTPQTILTAALEAGLSAVALTDHNTADGLPDFLRAAEGLPLLAVSGVEFSVDWEDKELHLLGLFIAPDRFAAVGQRMAEVNQCKEASNQALVASLNRAGYRLDYGAIRAAARGSVNRANIAAELKAQGYVASIPEAFETLLSPKGPHYRPPARPTVWEMLAFVRDIGAVPVLAHPFLKQTEEELRSFLPEAKKRGLIGMEVAYSKYGPQTTALSAQMAEAFGLLPSGGSDYHGWVKPDIRLGRGRGNLAVPYEWAEALLAQSR